jgi:tRNA A58 N-methylase Trm61
MKTVEELNGLFGKIKVYEVIQREILVRFNRTRPRERGITHTGYLVFARKINYYE